MEGTEAGDPRSDSGGINLNPAIALGRDIGPIIKVIEMSFRGDGRQKVTKGRMTISR